MDKVYYIVSPHPPCHGYSALSSLEHWNRGLSEAKPNPSSILVTLAECTAPKTRGDYTPPAYLSVLYLPHLLYLPASIVTSFPFSRASFFTGLIGWFTTIMKRKVVIIPTPPRLKQYLRLCSKSNASRMSFLQFLDM